MCYMSYICCVWQGPGQIDLRVESFLKMFETKLYEMPGDEFKVSCSLFPLSCSLHPTIICTFQNKKFTHKLHPHNIPIFTQNTIIKQPNKV